MSTRYTTCKISRYGLRLLRHVAAETNEKHYHVMERLLEAEYRRLHLPTTAPAATAPKETRS